MNRQLLIRAFCVKRAGLFERRRNLTQLRLVLHRDESRSSSTDPVGAKRGKGFGNSQPVAQECQGLIQRMSRGSVRLSNRHESGRDCRSGSTKSASVVMLPAPILKHRSPAANSVPRYAAA